MTSDNDVWLYGIGLIGGFAADRLGRFGLNGRTKPHCVACGLKGDPHRKFSPPFKRLPIPDAVRGTPSAKIVGSLLATFSRMERDRYDVGEQNVAVRELGETRAKRANGWIFHPVFKRTGPQAVTRASSSQHLRIVRERRLSVLGSELSDQFGFNCQRRMPRRFQPRNAQVVSGKMPDQSSSPVTDRLARSKISELPNTPSKIIGFTNINDLRFFDPIGTKCVGCH